jgi:hypothetical protein
MSSFWIESTPATRYSMLETTLKSSSRSSAQASLALRPRIYLKEAGKRVALLEMKRLARGATGYTHYEGHRGP